MIPVVRKKFLIYNRRGEKVPNEEFSLLVRFSALFLLPIRIEQVFHPHVPVFFQVGLPGRTDSGFILSFQDVQAYLVGAHQQVEETGAAEELVSLSGLPVRLVEQEDVFQRESGRRSRPAKVESVAGLSVLERILVRTGRRPGYERIREITGNGTSDNLERTPGTPSHTYGSPLEGTQGRVEGDGLVVRQVGRGFHRKGIRLSVSPSAHRNDGQLTPESVAQPAFAVHHPGQFADGTSVQYRDGRHAHETLVATLQHRSVDVVARVGAIQQEEGLVLFGTGLHHVIQGTDVGIEAGTCVLNVEYHPVRPLQLFRLRLLVLPVQGVDGYTGTGIFPVSDRFARVGGSTESVFRCQNLHGAYSQGAKRVEQVCFAYSGGLVYYQGDPFSFQERKVLFRLVGSGTYVLSVSVRQGQNEGQEACDDAGG